MVVVLFGIDKGKEGGEDEEEYTFAYFLIWKKKNES